jgi:hypothetical protein
MANGKKKFRSFLHLRENRWHVKTEGGLLRSLKRGATVNLRHPTELPPTLVEQLPRVELFSSLAPLPL